MRSLLRICLEQHALKKYTYKICEEPNAIGDCFICREPYNTNDACRAISLSCTHVIGDECFRKWATRFPLTCPYWNHHLPADIFEPDQHKFFTGIINSKWFEASDKICVACIVFWYGAQNGDGPIDGTIVHTYVLYVAGALMSHCGLAMLGIVFFWLQRDLFQKITGVWLTEYVEWAITVYVWGLIVNITLFVAVVSAVLGAVWWGKRKEA